MTSAIVIQCAIKPDTLDGLCRSLLSCTRSTDYHLIFWADAPREGAQFERHRSLNKAVLSVAARFADEHSSRFASIEISGNVQNLGTCRTCQAAIDHALSQHEFVVFTEDDTVFAADALEWFSALRDQRLLERPDILALAGESILFDARGQSLPPGYEVTAKSTAEARNLGGAYCTLGFVPSTCFATDREKWRTFGQLRGQPRGDEDVCEFCREKKLLCVFPIVARVKDVGMQHADGYSVQVLGAANVREVKNTYLMSDQVSRTVAAPYPYLGNIDQLFQESVKLTGFATPDLKAPVIASASVAWKLWCFSMRNFGDALTAYLLSRYNVPYDLVDDFAHADLLGIGSNLDRVRPDNSRITVWSAGFMYPKSRPVRYGSDVRFLGVRGKQTLSAIAPETPGDLAIGDGGLLVAAIFPHSSVPKTHELGLIPHMSDANKAKSLDIGKQHSVKMIDVLAPVDDVLRAIASCKRILSSSLHGIITADAFGIPSGWAVFAEGREVEGDGFKYRDYASALNYEIKRIDVGPFTTLQDAMDAIDGRHWAPTGLGAVIDGLEMTMQLLRGRARRLCSI